jgi:hypothetical protein
MNMYDSMHTASGHTCTYMIHMAEQVCSTKRIQRNFETDAMNAPDLLNIKKIFPVAVVKVDLVIIPASSFLLSYLLHHSCYHTC